MAGIAQATTSVLRQSECRRAPTQIPSTGRQGCASNTWPPASTGEPLGATVEVLSSAELAGQASSASDRSWRLWLRNGRGNGGIGGFAGHICRIGRLGNQLRRAAESAYDHLAAGGGTSNGRDTSIEESSFAGSSESDRPTRSGARIVTTTFVDDEVEDTAAGDISFEDAGCFVTSPRRLSQNDSMSIPPGHKDMKRPLGGGLGRVMREAPLTRIQSWSTPPVSVRKSSSSTALPGTLRSTASSSSTHVIPVLASQECPAKGCITNAFDFGQPRASNPGSERRLRETFESQVEVHKKATIRFRKVDNSHAPEHLAEDTRLLDQQHLGYSNTTCSKPKTCSASKDLWLRPGQFKRPVSLDPVPAASTPSSCVSASSTGNGEQGASLRNQPAKGIRMCVLDHGPSSPARAAEPTSFSKPVKCRNHEPEVVLKGQRRSSTRDCENAPVCQGALKNNEPIRWIPSMGKSQILRSGSHQNGYECSHGGGTTNSEPSKPDNVEVIHADPKRKHLSFKPTLFPSATLPRPPDCSSAAAPPNNSIDTWPFPNEFELGAQSADESIDLTSENGFPVKKADVQCAAVTCSPRSTRDRWCKTISQPPGSVQAQLHGSSVTIPFNYNPRPLAPESSSSSPGASAVAAAIAADVAAATARAAAEKAALPRPPWTAEPKRPASAEVHCSTQLFDLPSPLPPRLADAPPVSKLWSLAAAPPPSVSAQRHDPVRICNRWRPAAAGTIHMPMAKLTELAITSPEPQGLESKAVSPTEERRWPPLSHADFDPVSDGEPCANLAILSPGQIALESDEPCRTLTPEHNRNVALAEEVIESTGHDEQNERDCAQCTLIFHYAASAFHEVSQDAFAEDLTFQLRRHDLLGLAISQLTFRLLAHRIIASIIGSSFVIQRLMSLVERAAFSVRGSVARLLRVPEPHADQQLERNENSFSSIEINTRESAVRNDGKRGDALKDGLSDSDGNKKLVLSAEDNTLTSFATPDFSMPREVSSLSSDCAASHWQWSNGSAHLEADVTFASGGVCHPVQSIETTGGPLQANPGWCLPPLPEAETTQQLNEVVAAVATATAAATMAAKAAAATAASLRKAERKQKPKTRKDRRGRSRHEGHRNSQASKDREALPPYGAVPQIICTDASGLELKCSPIAKGYGKEECHPSSENFFSETELNAAKPWCHEHVTHTAEQQNFREKHATPLYEEEDAFSRKTHQLCMEHRSDKFHAKDSEGREDLKHDQSQTHDEIKIYRKKKPPFESEVQQETSWHNQGRIETSIIKTPHVDSSDNNQPHGTDSGTSQIERADDRTHIQVAKRDSSRRRRQVERERIDKDASSKTKQRKKERKESRRLAKEDVAKSNNEDEENQDPRQPAYHALFDSSSSVPQPLYATPKESPFAWPSQPCLHEQSQSLAASAAPARHEPLDSDYPVAALQMVSLTGTAEFGKPPKETPEMIDVASHTLLACSNTTSRNQQNEQYGRNGTIYGLGDSVLVPESSDNEPQEQRRQIEKWREEVARRDVRRSATQRVSETHEPCMNTVVETGRPCSNAAFLPAEASDCKVECEGIPRQVSHASQMQHTNLVLPDTNLNISGPHMASSVHSSEDAERASVEEPPMGLSIGSGQLAGGLSTTAVRKAQDQETALEALKKKRQLEKQWWEEVRQRDALRLIPQGNAGTREASWPDVNNKREEDRESTRTFDTQGGDSNPQDANRRTMSASLPGVPGSSKLPQTPQEVTANSAAVSSDRAIYSGAMPQHDSHIVQVQHDPLAPSQSKLLARGHRPIDSLRSSEDPHEDGNRDRVVERTGGPSVGMKQPAIDAPTRPAQEESHIHGRKTLEALRKKKQIETWRDQAVQRDALRSASQRAEEAPDAGLSGSTRREGKESTRTVDAPAGHSNPQDATRRSLVAGASGSRCVASPQPSEGSPRRAVESEEARQSPIDDEDVLAVLEEEQPLGILQGETKQQDEQRKSSSKSSSEENTRAIVDAMEKKKQIERWREEARQRDQQRKSSSKSSGEGARAIAYERAKQAEIVEELVPSKEFAMDALEKKRQIERWREEARQRDQQRKSTPKSSGENASTTGDNEITRQTEVDEGPVSSQEPVLDALEKKRQIERWREEARQRDQQRKASPKSSGENARALADESAIQAEVDEAPLPSQVLKKKLTERRLEEARQLEERRRCSPQSSAVSAHRRAGQAATDEFSVQDTALEKKKQIEKWREEARQRDERRKQKQQDQTQEAQFESQTRLVSNDSSKFGPPPLHESLARTNSTPECFEFPVEMAQSSSPPFSQRGSNELHGEGIQADHGDRLRASDCYDQEASDHHDECNSSHRRLRFSQGGDEIHYQRLHRNKRDNGKQKDECKSRRKYSGADVASGSLVSSSRHARERLSREGIGDGQQSPSGDNDLKDTLSLRRTHSEPAPKKAQPQRLLIPGITSKNISVTPSPSGVSDKGSVHSGNPESPPNCLKTNTGATLSRQLSSGSVGSSSKAETHASGNEPPQVVVGPTVLSESDDSAGGIDAHATAAKISPLTGTFGARGDSDDSGGRGGSHIIAAGPPLVIGGRMSSSVTSDSDGSDGRARANASNAADDDGEGRADVSRAAGGRPPLTAGRLPPGPPGVVPRRPIRPVAAGRGQA